MSAKMKRILLYSILFLLALLLVLAVIYFLQDSGEDTPAVVLPTAAAEHQASGDEEEGDGVTQLKAEINPDTVQSVLSVMERLESYTQTASVTTYAGTQTSASVISLWVLGDSIRSISVSEAGTRNVLLDGDTMWIWYSGQDAVYEAPRRDTGAYSADVLQGAPTYEDILALDADAITRAGYVDFTGKSCVYVAYTAGELGYSYEVYIAVDSGLLIGANIYDGDTLIYALTTDSLTEGVSVEEELFTPPN